jgi:transcriptional antiterminator RfaH
MSQGLGQVTGSWYTVHTKPRKEHAVQDVLQSRGIDTYLPVLKADSKRPRPSTGEKPFFSCYLFAHMNLTRVPLSSVNWAPGVTRVVSFGGQPAVVPEEVIDWLKERLARIDSRDYYQGLPLRAGERLRVVRGPLKGAEAIFDRRLSAGYRAQVFIDMLGRLTTCQIDLNCLQRT